MMFAQRIPVFRCTHRWHCHHTQPWGDKCGCVSSEHQESWWGRMQGLPAKTIACSSQSKFSEGKWLPGERSSPASPRAIARRDRRRGSSHQGNCLWKWPRGRAWSEPPPVNKRLCWCGLTSSPLQPKDFFSRTMFLMGMCFVANHGHG